MASPFGDLLFGSSGTPSQVVDVTPDSWNALQPQVAGGISGLLSSGGGDAFTGPMTAGITSNEQMVLNNVMGVGAQPSATQGALGTLSGTATGSMDPNTNPMLASLIQTAQRPIIEQFQEEVVPGLRSQFTQAGQQIQGEGSSPFQMAGARAASGFASALGDTATQVTSGERDRQQQAAMAIPGLERQQVDTMLATLEAQALPRLIEQLGIDRGMEEFRRREQQLLQALSLGAGVSAPNTVVLEGQAGTPGLVQGAVAAGVNAYTGGLGTSLAAGDS